MRRREFSTLLGGAATASTVWPSPLGAQKATPVIGYLGISTPGPSAPSLAAFRQGLSETGYVEGQNLTIEYRWAEGRYDRLPALLPTLSAAKLI
jgi:putative tryptophan/tyrosine transport system substrate-binding protein